MKLISTCRPGCAASAATLLAILCALALSACSTSSKARPTPTPEATAAASTAAASSTATTPATAATAATETIAGLRVLTWKINEPKALPEAIEGDVVIFVEKGCIECDGPVEAIQRVASIGNPGEVVRSVETSFTAPGDNQRTITSSLLGTNGNDALYATVCARGNCGPVGLLTPDAQTSLYVSRDGGISWESQWTRDGAWQVVSATSEGGLLRYLAPGASAFEYIDFQGNFVALPPPRAGAKPVGFGPLYGYAWLLDDGVTLVNSRGETIFRAPPEVNRITPAGALDNRNPERFVVSSGTAQALVRGGEVVGVYRTPSRTSTVVPGAWLDERTAVGNWSPRAGDLPAGSLLALVSSMPVLINFARAEITPLLLFGPLTPEAYRGRNYIRGLQRGTFWRVATGGDCLNMRAGYSTSAKVLACFKDNVLLRGAGPVETDETGRFWGAMHGPGSVSGWVAMEHVVRR